jgi:AAA15 family ATPase/GTPase
MQTLSFATTGLKSKEAYAYIDENNVFESHGQKCFKTIGLYGANASGKSNIIKALDYFIAAVFAQPSASSNLGNLCQPFLFQENPEATASFFQMVFVLNDTKYRYGFTVSKNKVTQTDIFKSSGERVVSEWLFSDKGKNMSPLFIREGDLIIKNTLPNKSSIPTNIPHSHNLFLAHAAAFDAKGDSGRIFTFFRGFLLSNLDHSSEQFRFATMILLRNIAWKPNVLKLLEALNFQYEDIELEEHKSDIEGDAFPLEKVYLIKKNDTLGEGNLVRLNLKYNESSGTQKIFDLAGMLYFTFNAKWETLVIIDEIDGHFHPALLIKLVNLFNDPTINKSNAQLLFTSHDTNLMSPSIMRRDQFYFTEKTNTDSTRLYSLGDLKGIRNDADFARQYLAGYYGALPKLEAYTPSSLNLAVNE